MLWWFVFRVRAVVTVFGSVRTDLLSRWGSVSRAAARGSGPRPLNGAARPVRTLVGARRTRVTRATIST